ncbi:MAG: hypothetical protein HY696_12005 [Deltaproteobacteria bacterium]|nr:hypothetical protein [Deltaproteobacteria bacterium]
MGKLVLPLTGSPQNHEYHLCDNPEEAVWRELLIFAEPFVLKKYWNGSKNEELITFVCTSIRQAYEYYRASKQLGENTAPLFLYYSCHNLTKAVLTVKNDSMEDLNHHGLTTTDRAADLFKYRVKQCAQGVFGKLTQAFGMTWALDDNQEFLFSDFIKNTIEFVDPIGNIFEQEPTIIPIGITRNTEGLVTLSISIVDSQKRQQIRRLVNEKTDLKNHFDENSGSDESYDYFKQYADKATLQKDGCETVRKMFSFSYLPCNEKIIYLDVSERRLPQACCYYGMVYILGMIVRYSPQIIGGILTNPNSEYRWLIEQVCLNTRRLYPNYMLNLMTGKSYKFVTSV